MNVIEKRDGKNRIKRSCSVRCYDAKGTKCICICGGVNHGVGVKKAIQNSKKLFKNSNLVIPNQQLELFKKED